MGKGVIYLIENIKNNKKYIGQAVNFLSSGRKWGSEGRWKSHIKQATNGSCECRLLENAIRKYGVENFVVKDLLECKTEELNLNEIKLIEKYNTLYPNGYNLMTGGGNGRLHSEETKKLMSKSRTGKTHSELTKERIGNSNRGLKVSVEGKKNISKASRYRNMNEYNKKRIKEALSKLDLTELPMYIIYCIKRKTETIVVRNPKIKYKQFGKKNMSLEEKIKLAIEYNKSHT